MAADTHTDQLALAAATHTPGAPSAAALHTPGAPTYGGLWQQEPHTRWARLLQQPHMHTSRYCPAASHPRARAIPSNRWSSRRAFTEVGSLQAHRVMREAGTRARARARARARTFGAPPAFASNIYPSRPLNVFCPENGAQFHTALAARAGGGRKCLFFFTCNPFCPRLIKT